MNFFSSTKSTFGENEDSSHHSSESLLGDKDNQSDRKISSTLSVRAVWILTGVNITILLSWITIAVSIFLKDSQLNENFRRISAYSPIFDKVNLHLDPTTINDTLWATNEATSIYTSDPSPEVDAAWNRISAEKFDLTLISHAEAEKLHRDPKIIAKAPENWGDGSDMYLAQIDVFHQIHCLDELRKQIYKEYYYVPRYGDDFPPFHMAHKKHCIHMLLHNLMCQSNVDIITHSWREGSKWPLADFNPPRQCRNFEALLEWNREHSVKDFEKKWLSFTRPADAVVLPSPTPRIY